MLGAYKLLTLFTTTTQKGDEQSRAIEIFHQQNWRSYLNSLRQ
jgi:hypothetical protein